MLAQASSPEGNEMLMLPSLRHRAQMVKPFLTGSVVPMPLLPVTSWCKKAGGECLGG